MNTKKVCWLFLSSVCFLVFSFIGSNAFGALKRMGGKRIISGFPKATTFIRTLCATVTSSTKIPTQISAKSRFCREPFMATLKILPFLLNNIGAPLCSNNVAFDLSTYTCGYHSNEDSVIFRLRYEF